MGSSPQTQAKERKENPAKNQDEKIQLSVKLQYLEALRQAAYESFNDRRSYEWKLSLAIWTALAIVIVGVVQPLKDGNPFPFHGRRYAIIAGIAGLMVIFLHIYFSNCVARANAIDRKKARDYNRRIESSLNLEDTDLKKEINDQIKKLPSAPEHPLMQWWQWGHLVQIALTILLITLAVGIVWVRVT